MLKFVYDRKIDDFFVPNCYPIKDNFYDVVMCVGTFTFAHVKAHALDEFIRITKKNGFICFTINE